MKIQKVDSQTKFQGIEKAITSGQKTLISQAVDYAELELRKIVSKKDFKRDVFLVSQNGNYLSTGVVVRKNGCFVINRLNDFDTKQFLSIRELGEAIKNHWVKDHKSLLEIKNGKFPS